jgi:hypothetical protein
LWAPFILFVAVAALAHRRARKPKPGTCGRSEAVLDAAGKKLLVPAYGTKIVKPEAVPKQRFGQSRSADTLHSGSLFWTLRVIAVVADQNHEQGRHHREQSQH